MPRALDRRLARLEARARRQEAQRAELDAMRAMIADLLTPEQVAAGITVDAVLHEAQRLAAMPRHEARHYFQCVYATLSPEDRQEADGILRRWGLVLGVD